MATNGRRNTATSSYALNVGAQMPVSGSQTAPHPLPAPALTSANVPQAEMKDMPTSGPVSASMIHQDRDVISSRHSLRSSQSQAPLGERKKDLL